VAHVVRGHLHPQAGEEIGDGEAASARASSLRFPTVSGAKAHTDCRKPPEPKDSRSYWFGVMRYRAVAEMTQFSP
jgi:hypothetical protein